MSLATADRVRDIIASHLRVSADRLGDDVNLVDDLGMDSLAAVEVILSVEQEFDIDVPDVEIQGLRTLREIIHYLAKRGDIT